MNILHITPRYHPARGGAENHLAEISNRLVAKGHNVTVLTSDALDVELFWQKGHRRIHEPLGVIEGVNVQRFPIRHLPLMKYTFAAVRRLLWLLSYLPSFPTKLSWRLARFTPWVPDLWAELHSPSNSFASKNFDLVAVMGIGFEPFFEAGETFAKLQQIPFVTYPLAHLGAGEKPGEDALGRFYTMRHQTALVKASDGVIAQTATEKQFYESKGVAPDQIWPIGPGVNPSDFLADGELKGNGEAFRQRHNIQNPLVISISQMCFDKGTEDTVEAVRQLWAAGVEVDLALAGAILEPFAQFLDQLPRADRERIHVLGFISDEERYDMLAAADILSMPSRTDSFGVVYLEAWLYGMPVIGANTWGVNSVIAHNEDGILVPFNNKTAVAEAIRLLIDDPAVAQSMGEKGKHKVMTQHTWDHKIGSIEKIYTQLVEQSQKRKTTDASRH